jgi:uncharacterized RDD family membrane protein YckC
MAATDETPSAPVAARVQAQAAARRVHGPPAQADEEDDYAGIVTRAIAFAIDAAIIDLVGIAVGVVFALIFSVLPESDELRSVAVAVGAVVFVVWSATYFLTFWCTTGETFGNRAMRIRVSRLDGGALKPRHALVRLVGIVLAAIPLFAGFVPILVTEKRRGLPDYLAGTIVRGRVG